MLQSIPRSRDAVLHETFRLTLVAIAAGLCFKTVVFLYWDWEHLALAARGVVEGRPHWRAYQNRLLGPYAAHALTHLGVSYKIALLLLTALILLLHHVLLYACFRRASVAPWMSLLLVFVWSFLFVSLLDRRWFYIWDAIDLLVFTWASLLVVFSRRPALILLAFPFAIENRESALFLPAAYMIREGMSVIAQPVRMANLARTASKMIGASALLIGGALYTKYVRDALFIAQLNGGDDTANALIGNHVHLAANLNSLFLANFRSIEALVSVTILIASAFMARVFAATRDDRIRSGVAFFFLLLGNILVFGLINETRMLFPLISLTMFVAIAHIQAKREDEGSPLTPSAANPP